MTIAFSRYVFPQYSVGVEPKKVACPEFDFHEMAAEYANPDDQPMLCLSMPSIQQPLERYIAPLNAEMCTGLILSLIDQGGLTDVQRTQIREKLTGGLALARPADLAAIVRNGAPS